MKVIKFYLNCLKNNPLNCVLLFSFFVINHFFYKFCAFYNVNDILIPFLIHQMVYVKDILFSNFYNKCILQIKIFLNENYKNNLHIDNYLQKILAVKEFMQNLINILTYSQIAFIKIAFSIQNLSFILLYFFFTIVLQKFILNLRQKAWKSTREANEYLQHKIMNEKELIEQNFLSINNSYINKEYQIWNFYYIFSNLSKLVLNCIFMLLFYQHNINLILIYSLSNVAKHFKLAANAYFDLNSILNFIALKNTNKSFEISNEVVLKNVCVRSLGPINAVLSEEIAIIEGENGSGKTTLAKAIANLIEYSGEIFKPKSLYLDSNSCNFLKQDMQKSQGEKIIFLIEKAIEMQYKLLILDEVLDNISKANLPKILKKLKENKIQLILISHNEEIAKLATQRIKL